MKKYSEDKYEDNQDMENMAKFSIADIVLLFSENKIKQFNEAKDVKELTEFRPNQVLFDQENSQEYPLMLYLSGTVKKAFTLDFLELKKLIQIDELKSKTIKLEFYPDFLKINEREMYWLKKELCKGEYKEKEEFKQFSRYLSYYVKDCSSKVANNYKFVKVFRNNSTDYWRQGKGSERNSTIQNDLMNKIGHMIHMQNHMHRTVASVFPMVNKSILPPKLGTLDWFSGFTMTDKEKEQALLAEKKENEPSEREYGLVTSEPLQSQNVHVNPRNYIQLTENTDLYNLFHDEKEILGGMKDYFMSNFFNLSRLNWGSGMSYEIPVRRY
jgi:hypothetical protein